MAKLGESKYLIIAQIFLICIAVLVQTENAPTFQTDDTFYLIWNQEKLTWHQALEFCKARNMSLVSFDSHNSLIQLNTFLMKNDFIDRAHIDNDYIYWTGGNDLQHAGTFVWASTGAPFNYTNWLPQMPDNWRGDEHCVEMGYRILGRWNDNRCWYRRHFICQRSR